MEPNFPDHDCNICPRLKSYIDFQRIEHPEWHNGPVRSFGSIKSEVLILGLAPGLHGANTTGRPFTGDMSGILLFEMIEKYGFSNGKFENNPDDKLELINCRISNAVRCVPPENRPTGVEMNNCLPFLKDEIEAMSNLKAIMCLGTVSHNNALKALGYKQSHAKFAHNAKVTLDNGITLFDSYHCSRYNLNTRRLTPEMFEDVFKDIKKYIEG